ncbi:Hypp7955 [Branchiostoma lanceolatum]|uniref:Hypp7955 protein n=1 Tax=Branchiostoma lanceolatum TaxID=7740 RepID=A0A8J9Z5L6_BRALA|nr:Hypp7955 [Branchiostoma lanceolatum]
MPLPKTHDLHLYGSINGHEFDMAGGGSGDASNGTIVTKLTSTKGALKFSPYLLIPHLGYGYYQYLPFPDGPSPFQAAMLDGSGYDVVRTFDFEDGAKLTIEYKYVFEGTNIKGEFKAGFLEIFFAEMTGTGFPDDGPVMTSQIVGQDRCVSRTRYTADNNTMIDSFEWTYNLKDGRRYLGNGASKYMFKRPVQAVNIKMDPIFVYRKCDVTATKTEVTLDEVETAFYTV